VMYAHVVYDNATKRSKGFGYIEMEETDHAINAINALNGIDINGRKLDVKIASPKGNRPQKKEPPIKAEKKTFKKMVDRPKVAKQETKIIKPNPVERDSEGRVVRK
jgi:RNA recognition motif-containing protein